MRVCPNFFLEIFGFQISDKMVKQMTKIQRAKALGFLQAGWNITEVAEKVGRNKSVISRLAKKAREMGEERAMVRKPGGGRRNLATLSDIKKIIRGSGKYPRGVRKVPSPWQELKILYQHENK